MPLRARLPRSSSKSRQVGYPAQSTAFSLALVCAREVRVHSRVTQLHSGSSGGQHRRSLNDGNLQEDGAVRHGSGREEQTDCGAEPATMCRG